MRRLFLGFAAGIFLVFCVSPASAFMLIDGRALLNMGWGDNMCALTFDDGPGPHTERLLALLRERGIKATFFVVGTQASARPHLIRQLQTEGHEIGNHTLHHVNLRHMAPGEQEKEILAVQKILADQGVHARFVRPPYGRYDLATVDILKKHGLDVMLWSIDSMDWMHKAEVEKMQTLVPGQRLRGVFLFHDTHSRTVDSMPEILDRLEQDGCHFVTISQYLEGAGRWEPQGDVSNVSALQSPEPNADSEGLSSGSSSASSPEKGGAGGDASSEGTALPSAAEVRGAISK